MALTRVGEESGRSWKELAGTSGLFSGLMLLGEWGGKLSAFPSNPVSPRLD